MNNEQRQRIKQIQEQQPNRRRHSTMALDPQREKVMCDDIDFLLSLVKSQEEVGNYSKLAHEIISEYNSADNPGLLRQKIAEGFAQVATSMRSACVEKAKAVLRSYELEFRSKTNSATNIVDYVAMALESVSIQDLDQ